MVPLPRRRRRRLPRPSGLVVVALVLCGLTLLTGVVLLANAVAASPAGAGDVAFAAAIGPQDRPARRAARSRPAGRPPLPGRAAPSEPTPRPGVWVRPVGGALLRGFEPPAGAWGRGHRGVDLAADPDAPIRAAGAGVIGWAGRVAGRGVVTVVHDGGLRTTYEPVTAQVAVGRRVEAGSILGVLERGTGHCGSRPCLHWGLLRGHAYLDPFALLGHGRPVLVPFWAPTEAGVRGRGQGCGSASFARSASMTLVWICETRLSETPSSRPMSARVRLSK